MAVARQAAVLTILATALNHLGNALMASQRYPEALQAYDEGIALAERSADAALAVTPLTNAIHAHLAIGSAQEAIPVLQVALTKTRTLPASHDKAFDLITLGHLAQHLAVSIPAHRRPLIQAAYQAFTEARVLAEGLADARASAYALGHLGELYAMEGCDRDAEQWFRQALFFATQAQIHGDPR